MDTNPVVYDISSDDDSPSPPPPPSTDEDGCDWIRNILDNLNGGEEEQSVGGDSDDEVVILGEKRNTPKLRPKAKPKPKPKPKSVVVKAITVSDDEDCVVLDGDPDVPVHVAADGGGSHGNDDDEEDDLLVVGQKGQVACRDYPHLRHLCFRFPFKSTPHNSYCELCYCYVCDAPAPCALWSRGDSSVDHCHATDKLEVWKTLRKKIRLEFSPSLAPPDTTILGAAMTQSNQTAPANHVCQPIKSSSQFFTSRKIHMRPCSSSSPFGTPRIVKRSRK